MVRIIQIDETEIPKCNRSRVQVASTTRGWRADRFNVIRPLGSRPGRGSDGPEPAEPAITLREWNGLPEGSVEPEDHEVRDHLRTAGSS